MSCAAAEDASVTGLAGTRLVSSGLFLRSQLTARYAAIAGRRRRRVNDWREFAQTVSTKSV